MMQSMKGATHLLGSMNRQMNLPALQRIAMEFERENEVMDERQEMMDDAIDEATGMEGEEEEGEDVMREVLDSLGVELGGQVCHSHSTWAWLLCVLTDNSWAKRPPTYKRQQKNGPLLRRQSAAVEVDLPLMTTTSRPGLMAFDDDRFPLAVIPSWIGVAPFLISFFNLRF
jgi:hypothetical protein